MMIVIRLARRVIVMIIFFGLLAGNHEADGQQGFRNWPEQDKQSILEGILFQVDMRLSMRYRIFEPSSQDRIVVRGTFNSWKGSAQFLSDVDGDSIYTLSYELDGSIGDFFEYKFVICRNDGREIWEQNPEPQNPPYGNRKLTLTGEPQRLSVAVFAVDKYELDGQIKFTVEELREDIRQLRDSIEGLHPALYDFTNKATFDALFDQQYMLIDKSTTGVEFFRIAVPLIARIGCGHSTLAMPESWWLNQPDRFFPLRLHMINNVVFAMRSYGNSALIPAGSSIIEINGTSAKEIVAKMLSMISADGYNFGYRVEQLNRRFSFLYALHYGFPDGFLITYQTRNSSKNQTIYLEPVTGEMLAAASRWKSRREFRVIKQHNTAVLSLNNFNYYDKQDDFRSFIDTSFDKIHKSKIPNLILDLRDNDGGDPFSAAYLLSYIAPSPIPYFSEESGPYLSLAKPIQLAENQFTGNLFVLINSRCFSTTGHLCALLRYHKIGTLLGSETGGTYACNDAKVTIPLKNTNLHLQVAQRSLAVAVTGIPKDRGIIPDIVIDENIDNLVQGKDRVFEFAIELIDKKSNVK